MTDRNGREWSHEELLTSCLLIRQAHIAATNDGDYETPLLILRDYYLERDCDSTDVSYLQGIAKGSPISLSALIRHPAHLLPTLSFMLPYMAIEEFYQKNASNVIENFYQEHASQESANG